MISTKEFLDGAVTPVATKGNGAWRKWDSTRWVGTIWSTWSPYTHTSNSALTSGVLPTLPVESWVCYPGPVAGMMSDMMTTTHFPRYLKLKGTHFRPEQRVNNTSPYRQRIP